MAVALNLPTQAQTGSGEQRPPLPKDTYLAKVAYYFFDKHVQMGTTIDYQEVQIKYLIKPDDVDALPREVREALDDEGFYPYLERFNELQLLPERETSDGRTLKPSRLVRRLNAALANDNKQFTDESIVGYEYDEGKVESLGKFPVYVSISKDEAEAYKDKHGTDPDGMDKYKVLDGQEQEIYKGVIKDILIDGLSTIGKWVSIELDVNKNNYNKTGANSVKPLSSMERKALASILNEPPKEAKSESAIPGL